MIVGHAHPAPQFWQAPDFWHDVAANLAAFAIAVAAVVLVERIHGRRIGALH